MKTAWKRRLFASASAVALCCMLPSLGEAGAIDIVLQQEKAPRIADLPRVSAPVEWAVYEPAKAVSASAVRAQDTASKIHSMPIKSYPRRARPGALEIAWSDILDPAKKISMYQPIAVKQAVSQKAGASAASLQIQKTEISSHMAIKREMVAQVPVQVAPAPVKVNPPQPTALTVPAKKRTLSALETIAVLEKKEQSEAHIKVTSDATTTAQDTTIKSEQNLTVVAELQPTSSIVTQPEPVWQVVDNSPLAVAELEPAAGEPVDLLPPKAPKIETPKAEEGTPNQVQPKELPPQRLSPIEAAAKEGAFTAEEIKEPPHPDMVQAHKPSVLSDESKAVLDRLPPERMTGKNKKDVKLDRSNKSSGADSSEKKHEAYGMRISVKRPQMDVFRMLESAYNSLIAGDQQYAITLYKEVLEADPKNTLALFGLATTYHRAGQTQLARPLYGKLLEIDPHNVEGLNNFLVLLADESPGEALVELERLRRSHPSFSPVLAQMALIYEKQGDYNKASEKLAQAYALSPENLKYQYNMAIVLDKMKDWEEAARWYQRLLTAGDRGEKIPGNAQEIQQRLTFIRSNTSSVN